MRIGLGCVALGTNRRVSEDVRLVHAAIDHGVDVFDTADAYGAGASEHVLGRALRHRRDGVVVATKGGFVVRERRPLERWARRRAKSAVRAAVQRRRSGVADGRAVSGSYARQDFSPTHIRDAVHASLRRLRTDRIDVYLVHGPEEVHPELFDQLSDLVVTGDVVRFGVGAGTVAVAEEWIGVDGLSVVEVPFGVLDPEAATAAFPSAQRHGHEIWVRGVLGGGVLSLAERDPVAMADHPKRALVEALQRTATEHGLDQYQLAFGFLRAHSANVSVAVVGSSSIDHLGRNLEMARAEPLDDDVLAAVTALTTARGDG